MGACAKLRPFGLAGLLAVVVGGCSPHPVQSGQFTKCRAAARGGDALRIKVAACTSVIAHGARGDALRIALANRGETEREQLDRATAVADFNAALRLKPDDTLALNGRGLAYLDSGKPGLALRDFNSAIRADSDNSFAFNNRGYLERTQGDFTAAMADASHAIELKPDDAVAWANRGYDYAGKHQWDSALADFDDALRRAPNLVFAREGKAASERGKGDNADAVKDYRAALNDPHGDNALADAQAVVQLSPAGDPEALNVRCWVRGVNDMELPEGLADCQQSLATRPNSAETLDSLALIYFRLGRYDDAITQYTAAFAADPTQTASQYMLGIAKLRAGDETGGRADIAAATTTDKTVAATFAGYGLKP